MNKTTENKKKIENLKHSIQVFEKAMEDPKLNKKYFEHQIELIKKEIEYLERS